jgi:hypothetical protein
MSSRDVMVVCFYVNVHGRLVRIQGGEEFKQ